MNIPAAQVAIDTNNPRSLISLQQPLPILTHILSYTILSVNDYDGINGVSRQWCNACSRVSAATVRFVHHSKYNTRQLFGTCQWRPTLTRSQTAVTDPCKLRTVNEWQTKNPSRVNQRIAMSPYLLAIRKYPLVASFHDFPFTQDISHLLPPNQVDINVLGGGCIEPIYSGPLLCTHTWRLSQLRSLVNLRSHDRRHGNESPTTTIYAILAIGTLLVTNLVKQRTPREMPSASTAVIPLSSSTAVPLPRQYRLLYHWWSKSLRYHSLPNHL